MKTKLTRQIEKDLKIFYPNCHIEVDECENGDGERSVDIFMNRDYSHGLFEKEELGGIKAVVYKRCGEKHNYYILNDNGTKNATVRTRAEILV